MVKKLILSVSVLFISCNGSQQENNSSKVIIKKKLSKISNAKIYTDYHKAFSIAKQKNKAVFILFYSKNCHWCTKLKETTLQDQEIQSRLKKEFIVLYLDRDNSLYPNKYKIEGIPSVYMTDKNEDILTTVVGYHKKPKDYIKWFDYVKIEIED